MRPRPTWETRSPMRPWQSRASLLVSLLLLGAGAAIGAALTVLVIVKQVQHRVHHPEVFPPRAAARLQKYLDLSGEQTRQVEAILRQRQGGLQAIRREVQPRIQAELDQARREIAAVLNEEQAQRWNAWVEQKLEAWLPELPKPTTQHSGQ